MKKRVQYIEAVVVIILGMLLMGVYIESPEPKFIEYLAFVAACTLVVVYIRFGIVKSINKLFIVKENKI